MLTNFIVQGFINTAIVVTLLNWCENHQANNLFIKYTLISSQLPIRIPLSHAQKVVAAVLLKVFVWSCIQNWYIAILQYIQPYHYYHSMEELLLVSKDFMVFELLLVQFAEKTFIYWAYFKTTKHYWDFDLQQCLHGQYNVPDRTLAYCLDGKRSLHSQGSYRVILAGLGETPQNMFLYNFCNPADPWSYLTTARYLLCVTTDHLNLCTKHFPTILSMYNRLSYAIISTHAGTVPIDCLTLVQLINFAAGTVCEYLGQPDSLPRMLIDMLKHTNWSSHSRVCLGNLNNCQKFPPGPLL